MREATGDNAGRPGAVSVTVRLARPEELDAVGAITVVAYTADGLLAPGSGYGAVLADAAGRAAHAEVLVAVDGADRPVGTVTVVPAGSRYAELAGAGELEFRMLAVTPAARGSGAGTALTGAVLRRARTAGARRVVLSSLGRMREAHRIYRRFGFQRLPERDWEPEAGTRLLAFGLELDAVGDAVDPASRSPGR